MKIKGIVFLLLVMVAGTGCATGQSGRSGQDTAMCLDGNPESFACERNLHRDRAFNGRNWF